LALEKSIYACLSEHMTGAAEPTAEKLFGYSKDIYFDYVGQADIAGVEDLKDIAGALQSKWKPRFNTNAAPTSGKYSKVAVEDVG
jgi:hypothetical protein